MSAGSDSVQPERRRKGRSAAGSLAFGAGLIFVLATMVLSGFAGAALASELGENSSLAWAVPDEGLIALIVGGMAAGAVLGLLLPLLLVGMFRGTAEKPRIGPREAAVKLLAALGFCFYLSLVGLLVSQLGWLLPESVTVLVAVFAVGFSWMPLALLPGNGTGIGGIIGRPLRPNDQPGESDEHQ
jgi:MFS family permease